MFAFIIYSQKFNSEKLVLIHHYLHLPCVVIYTGWVYGLGETCGQSGIYVGGSPATGSGERLVQCLKWRWRSPVRSDSARMCSIYWNLIIFVERCGAWIIREFDLMEDIQYQKIFYETINVQVADKSNEQYAWGQSSAIIYATNQADCWWAVF